MISCKVYTKFNPNKGIREMEQLEERLRTALSKKKTDKNFKEPRYIQLHSSIAWQDQQ